MKFLYPLFNSVIIVLFVAACSRKGAPLVSTMQTEGLHHKWKITRANDIQDVTAAYIDLRDVYRSGVTAGCRYFSFTPKFGYHNRVQIANISTHFLPCPQDPRDDILRSHLNSVYSFTLTGQQLQLLARDGHTLFVAEKATDDQGHSIARKWMIQEMINANNEQLLNDKAFIDLTNLNKAQGGVGCNKFSFEVKADDTYQISVGNAVATEMFCKQAASNESVFAKVLPLVNKYQVIGDRLKLFDKDNVLLLEGRSALK